MECCAQLRKEEMDSMFWIGFGVLALWAFCVSCYSDSHPDEEKSREDQDWEMYLLEKEGNGPSY